MNPLTIVEVQAFIKKFVGLQEGETDCIAASVEFGPNGGGIFARRCSGSTSGLNWLTNSRIQPSWH